MCGLDAFGSTRVLKRSEKIELRSMCSLGVQTRCRSASDFACWMRDEREAGVADSPCVWKRSAAFPRTMCQCSGRKSCRQSSRNAPQAGKGCLDVACHRRSFGKITAHERKRGVCAGACRRRAAPAGFGGGSPLRKIPVSKIKRIGLLSCIPVLVVPAACLLPVGMPVGGDRASVLP